MRRLCLALIAAPSGLAVQALVLSVFFVVGAL